MLERVSDKSTEGEHWDVQLRFVRLSKDKHRKHMKFYKVN